MSLTLMIGDVIASVLLSLATFCWPKTVQYSRGKLRLHAPASRGRNQRRMRRLWSCLRLALLDRLTEPDILAHIRVVKTLERVLPRFSPIAINGNVMSPKLIRIILSRRGLYSKPYLVVAWR